MLTKTENHNQVVPVKLSRRWHWASGQAISFLMHQAVENPNVISLAAGLVDPSTLPVDEARDVMQKVLGDRESGRQALQYGTTQGAERCADRFRCSWGGWKGSRFRRRGSILLKSFFRPVRNNCCPWSERFCLIPKTSASWRRRHILCF